MTYTNGASTPPEYITNLSVPVNPFLPVNHKSGEDAGDQYITYCAVCCKKTWHKCLNIAGKLVWICMTEHE